MDEKRIPYELLATYLYGQCTAAELELVNNWLDEDAEHSLLLDKLKKQWENIHSDTYPYVMPDKTMIWKKILHHIRRKTKQTYSRPFLIRVSGIAAAIALIVGFTLSYLFNNRVESWQANRFENIIRVCP